MVFAVTVMDEAASLLAVAVDAGVAAAAGDGVGAAVLADDDGDAVDAAEVVAGGAAGFSADVVDVAVLAAAAGFSVAAGVAGGTAAICVPVALLLAAGLDGTDAGAAAGVAGLSSAIAFADRKRGAPASCDDGSGAGEATPLTTSVMFEVAAGCDDLAAAPCAPFTSVASTSSSSQSDQPSFLPVGFITTSVDCAVWIWVCV